MRRPILAFPAIVLLATAAQAQSEPEAPDLVGTWQCNIEYGTSVLTKV